MNDQVQHKCCVALQKEDVEPLAGYLSLHQNAEGLTLKWTPNQLMNGGSEDDESVVDRRSGNFFLLYFCFVWFVVFYFFFEHLKLTRFACSKIQCSRVARV